MKKNHFDNDSLNFINFILVILLNYWHNKITNLNFHCILVVSMFFIVPSKTEKQCYQQQSQEIINLYFVSYLVINNTCMNGGKSLRIQ